MIGFQKAALAGFGLSAGHDAWRITKRNSGMLLLLILAFGAAYLPFLGARGIVRGHERGLAGTLFKTVAANLFLILMGISLGFGLSFLAFSVLSAKTEIAFQLSASLSFAVGASAAMVGLATGIIERPTRLRRFTILRANAQFMAKIGLRETGGADITHYDAEGNALRFLEAHMDRLVFLAVGRRGRRAYVSLDTEGRMLAYSGVVNI